MGAIVIRTRFDEGTESAEVVTSAGYSYRTLNSLKPVHFLIVKSIRLLFNDAKMKSISGHT